MAFDTTSNQVQTISLTGGSQLASGRHYVFSSSLSTSSKLIYELRNVSNNTLQQDQGISFYNDNSGNLTININEATPIGAWDPYFCSVWDASNTLVGSGFSGPVNVDVGYTVEGFDNSNNTSRVKFVVPTFVTASSSSVTVTDITIVTPYEYNDGVNNFWVDGEFVTNDTITASDCTLYNDFQSYANSNITIVGKKFGITKSGTGVYGISVGGAHATVDYVDESWVATISSNSSSRSTNSMRIKEVLAKIPDDIKFHRLVGLYSPQETGIAEARGPDTWYWATFDQLMWTKDKRDTSITYTYNYAMTNPYNTHRWYTDPFTERHRFEVREYNGEIKWRFSRYKWFNDLSLNLGLPSPKHNVLHSPWMEVGANSWCTWIWSWDPNEIRHGHSNYDRWLVDERFFVKVTDWVYYQEPEGDAEGPDGNPPHNYPPTENPPNDPPDDPDPPKHDYPGPWYAQRRRAHSFW